MRLGTWMAGVFCFLVAVTAADRESAAFDVDGGRFAYQEQVQQPELDNKYAKEWSSHAGESHTANTVVRPVSYTYFLSNVNDTAAGHVSAEQSTTTVKPHAAMQHLAKNYRPLLVHRIRYVGDEKSLLPVFKKTTEADPTKESTLASNQPSLHQLKNSDYDDNEIPSMTNRRTIRFPFKSVLPGNSVTFDDEPYSGLLQAMNTFSDLTTSRNPREGLLVTHNTFSLPASDDGVTTATRTRITNHGRGLGGRNNPIKNFEKTTHSTRGNGRSVVESTQKMTIEEGDDEHPAVSYASFKTGLAAAEHGNGKGGGSSETRHNSEKEQIQEVHQQTWKGVKGTNGYKKNNVHHKSEKGYHDEERDSGEFDEKLNKEKKYQNDEGFYGENHKSEKKGKGKKYGEGGKHKKGHTTHGEHNIVKKDEFIKKTRFYDEDHGGGEHEEHGVYYGHQEEKKGDVKRGRQKETDNTRTVAGKLLNHDKSYVETEREGRESGAGYETDYQQEVQFEGKKDGHVSKKWGSH